MDQAYSPEQTTTGKWWPFAAYVLIGLLKTGVGYAIFAALVLWGCRPQPALVITYVVIGILGYKAHACVVFKVNGWAKLWAYLAITSSVYLVNVGLLECCTWLSLRPLVSQLLCLVVTVPLGYSLLKWRMRA